MIKTKAKHTFYYLHQLDMPHAGFIANLFKTLNIPTAGTHSK